MLSTALSDSRSAVDSVSLLSCVVSAAVSTVTVSFFWQPVMRLNAIRRYNPYFLILFPSSINFYNHSILFTAYMRHSRSASLCSRNFPVSGLFLFITLSYRRCFGESISFPLRILKTKRKKTERTADLPFSQKISAYLGIKIPETGSSPFPAFSSYSHISILSARQASYSIQSFKTS